MDLRKARSLMDQSAGKRTAAEETVVSLRKDADRIKEEQEALAELQILIQETARAVQNRLQIRVEDIVQKAIDSTFGDEYFFHLDFVSERGRTSARLYLTAPSGAELDPLESNGGGLADVLSFALRVAVWSLDKAVRGADSVLVLDEPFKFLSAGLRGLGADMLRELAEKLKLQILMSSHVDEQIRIADAVVEVRKTGERSSVV